MSTQHFESMDELLRRALAERAIRPDDELTSDLLLAEMVRVAGSTPQRRQRWLIPRLDFGRWTPVVVVALLVAALAVSIAIGTALITRPDPPYPIDRTNGVIVSWMDGQLRAVPAEAGGGAEADIQLPPVSDSTDLAWAPDGRRFAYAAPGGAWIVDVTTGSAERTIECGSEATACTIDWAPDGSQIAVAQADTLKLVNPDGTEPFTLATFPDSFVHHPTWSPDSGRIGFVVATPDGRVLYVVNRNGSGLAGLYGPSPSGGIGIWDPDWSPDGTRIAFIASTIVDDRPVEQWLLNVTVIDADGSNARVILQDAGICSCAGYYPGMAWSPDGTSIALAIPGPSGSAAAATSPGDIYLMDADGGNLRKLTNGGFGALAWQPLPE